MFKSRGILLISLLFSLCIILPAVPSVAREAGWVPLPDKPWQPDFKSSTPSKPKKRAQLPPAKAQTKGATVYAGQPPITEAELLAFIALLPRFRAWTRQNHEEAHPIVTPQGKPDFLYSPKAAEWVKNQNFNPVRFFCAMGRMATCLAIIEEGNDLQTTRPADMPQVDKSEVILARRHIGGLLTAGGNPTPIN